jgi:hypothetical protein
MSAVELSEQAFEAASREAERRGTDVSAIVGEAVQRFVVGSDLRYLLDDFRNGDAASTDSLTEDEALQVANEELAAVRGRRR